MIGARTVGKWLLCCALAVFAGQLAPQAWADGFLSNIRDDVRSSETDSPSEPSSRDGHKDRRGRRHHDDDDDDGDSLFALFFGKAFFYGLTSPYWGPVKALNDTYIDDGCFGDFPYDGRSEGCMVFSGLSCDCGARFDETRESGEHSRDCVWYTGSSKRFSSRFTAEWAEQPGDMSRMSGRLQLNTTSRFGLDTQMDWLREPNSGPVDDELWLGDCNVVFRFAQSERAQFYSGLGFNWLDDPVDTEFGFNFTYGADFFPVKPWVVSSSIDWGSLGRAEQFRFRLTGGVMINRFEIFTGYEYLDIDRTQINSYVAGVGIWF